MLDEEMRLFGVFGDPVMHSLSPCFQNEAFKLLGIKGVYLKFRIKREQLATALQAIICLNFGGVNITIPHKQAVIPYLDQLAGDALLTGSVNTIVCREGRLIGYSTDGEGFLLSLRNQAGFDPKGKTVILLGVGGAAHAVAFRLVKEGVSNLYLVGRDQNKTELLSQIIKEKTGFTTQGALFSSPVLKDMAAQAELVVNATPVGMYPKTTQAPLFPLNYCRRDCLIHDLVYHPLETNFLRQARQLNLTTLEGLGMLIYQGILSCQLWTGLTPPFEPLYHLIEGILKDENSRLL